MVVFGIQFVAIMAIRYHTAMSVSDILCPLTTMVVFGIQFVAIMAIRYHTPISVGDYFVPLNNNGCVWYLVFKVQ